MSPHPTFHPSITSNSSHSSIPPVPVAALDKLHAKHVLPGFTDRSQEEREIESATIEITKVSSLSQHHSTPTLSNHYLCALPSIISYTKLQWIASPTPRGVNIAISSVPRPHTASRHRPTTCISPLHIFTSPGLSRKERTKRPCRKSSGTKRHLPKETARVHGQCVP